LTAGTDSTEVAVYDLTTKQFRTLKYWKQSGDDQNIKELLTPHKECIYRPWEDQQRLLD
jgi:hypothetical protein